jgi:hypothetical protein
MDIRATAKFVLRLYGRDTIERKYRIVKKRRTADQTAAIANRDRAKLLNGWRAIQNKTTNSYVIEKTI